MTRLLMGIFQTPLIINTDCDTTPSTSNAPVKWYQNQSGPPRGGGFSAVNVSYAYFQLQCVGSDSANSGAQLKYKKMS